MGDGFLLRGEVPRGAIGWRRFFQKREASWQMQKWSSSDRVSCR